MSNQLLALFTAAQVRLASARDDERGQTFVEWMGVMLVIVALVTAITTSNVLQSVAQTIATEASDAIKTVVG